MKSSLVNNRVFHIQSPKTDWANIAAFSCSRFRTLGTRQYLFQVAPHFDARSVDIQFEINSGNPPYPRTLKSDPEEQIKKSFRLYADKWYAETLRESSLTKITSNVNYLKVIKLGTGVVPLILKELQCEDPAPWFLALRVLTEEVNVGRENPGNFRKKAEAWVGWGRDHGLI